jgi:signal transduction histidine kinase
MGLGLLVAVWLLGVLAPRKSGLSGRFLLTYSSLLLALALVDQTAPRGRPAVSRRFVWLMAELVLCYYIVKTQGSVIRPALVYLLPTAQALLLFGERLGLVVSVSVWIVYGLNIWPGAWPHRLGDFPNYFSFFLAPYIVAVVLTAATLRQLAGRNHLQQLYDDLRRAHEQLRDLHARERQATVTEERNRIAREIHDTLAHYLTVINVQLEAAERLAAEQPARAAEQARRARRLTVECLQEVRRSVASLRAASLEELSVVSAISRLAEEFAANTGVGVELDVSLDERLYLPPEVALALYRTAQEGLTNVHRHAHASSANVSLAQRDDLVELAVTDNGTGPNGSSGEGGSFGLLGLRERVELVGGTLRFGPHPMGGSRLVVALPLGDSVGDSE